MKNRKATGFTRCEGGTIVPADFEIREWQLQNFKTGDVFKKKVYNKTFEQEILTRVVNIEGKSVHSLFFGPDRVYDVNVNGFELREYNNLKPILKPSEI